MQGAARRGPSELRGVSANPNSLERQGGRGRGQDGLAPQFLHFRPSPAWGPDAGGQLPPCLVSSRPAAPRGHSWGSLRAHWVCPAKWSGCLVRPDPSPVSLMAGGIQGFTRFFVSVFAFFLLTLKGHIGPRTLSSQSRGHCLDPLTLPSELGFACRGHKLLLD